MLRTQDTITCPCCGEKVKVELSWKENRPPQGGWKHTTVSEFIRLSVKPETD